jgi:hypothetical protein
MAISHRNLTQSRAPVNVWEQTGSQGWLDSIDRERLVCGAWGGLVALYGIRRGGWFGGALAAAGAGILARAVAGNNDLARTRSFLERALDVCNWWGRSSDRVIDESEMSFPASDAPSWTPTAGVRTRDERSRNREQRG